MGNDKMTDRTRYWIWLTQATGYCNPKHRHLCSVYSDIKTLYEGGEAELRLCGVFTEGEISRLLKTDISVADRIISRCNELGYKILSFEGEIFATLDTHAANYMETAEGKNLPVPHCIKGTPGWMLNDGVAAVLEQKGYTPVEKLTFGSVLLPRLLYQAAGGEEFSVELIGLCTDICVISNAMILKSAFPEAKIIVDAACCAGVTVESHNTALNAMKAAQIEIIE